MSMSTHVYGIRNLNGKFAAMMKIKLACDKVRIGYPKEVTDYFKCPSESEEDNKREMERVDISIAVSKADEDMTEGILVDLSKLTSEIKSVLFLNSW